MPQISPMKWYLLISLMAMNFLIMASQLSLTHSNFNHSTYKNIYSLKSFKLSW